MAKIKKYVTPSQFESGKYTETKMSVKRIAINPVLLGQTAKGKSFHQILKPLLITAQSFGLLPVEGITSADPKTQIRFSWFSYRMLYNLFCLIGSSGLGSLVIVRLTKNKFQFSTIIGVVFFADTFLISLIFTKIAYNWPMIITKFLEVEKIMQHYEVRNNLQRHINILFVVVMIISFVEHALSINKNIQAVSHIEENDSFIDGYFKNTFSQVFGVFSYARWKGFLSQFINLLCTFNWNFADLFLMVMGYALTQFFIQIRMAVKNLVEKNNIHVLPATYWADMRCDYTKVAKLTREINDEISLLILLSYTNNLFYVCIQLLRMVDMNTVDSRTVYFFFSLFYLIGRTCAVTMYLSKVHEASFSILGELFNVNDPVSNPQIAHFVMQINSDPISMTGNNFFSIQRYAILSVAGTIITYELVLLQYNVKVTAET